MLRDEEQLRYLVSITIKQNTISEWEDSDTNNEPLDSVLLDTTYADELTIWFISQVLHYYW